MRAVLVATLLVLFAGPTFSQTSNGPVMGSSAGQDAVSETDDDAVTRILVIGDGLAGGLGAGLMRVGEADGRYEVVNRYNEESGLARPEVYDWAVSLPKILESSEYDVVVALIGVNDRQMIRDGNVRYAFGSPDWLTSYTRQVDRLLDALKVSRARVYWVSVPPMQDPEHDAAMRQISGIQKERAEARGAVFVDIRSFLQKPDGSYLDTGPDDTGVVRRLRGRDGISFYKSGNNLMGQKVLEAIETRKAPVMATTGPSPISQQRITQPLRPARVVPVFGQTAFAGGDVTVRPENVTVSTALVLSADGDGLKPSEAMSMLRGIAQPGSAAERLFTDGASGSAPAGRADDFSAPPKASE